MKTVFKSALIACAALAVGLTGCQKENGGGIDKEAKTVTLRLVQGEIGGTTRAVATHVADAAITLTSARIYFTNDSGAIQDYVTIVVGSSDGYNEVAKTVGMDALDATGGTPITDVPAATTKVVIVGNLPGGSYLSAGNISDIADVTVANLFGGTNNGVANVPLYGVSGLTLKTAATASANGVYTAKVDVKPVGARFEVGQIAGDYTGTFQGEAITSKIKSYTLEGIYINNYYPTMEVDCATAGTIVHNGSVPGNYNRVAPYASPGIGDHLADYLAASLVAQDSPAITYAPKATANADTDVWGYNVLALTGGDVPHLIVRVSNVVVKTTDSTGKNPDEVGYVETLDATTYGPGAKFLTVRRIFVDGSTTALTSFERGYVYRIKKLSFAEQHLGIPEPPTAIDIEVEAELIPWVSKDVDYEFE
uniref:Major fimbrial subunit protein N-terminal domain-containing protein n=1 Tax=termite gut metagenome TaxID=433724 RepID=S0DE32_9ZZZZ